MAFRLARLLTGRSRKRKLDPADLAPTDGPATFADEDWEQRFDLLPRAIIRQVLFDPIELPPAWLRARSGAAPSGLTAAPSGPASGAAPATTSASTTAAITPEEPKPASRTRQRRTPAAASGGATGTTRPRTKRPSKRTSSSAED